MRAGIARTVEELFGFALPEALIPNQAILVGLGFLAAALAALYLGRRDGLSTRQLSLGLAVCFLGALLGSRLMGLMLRLPVAIEDPSLLLNPGRLGSGSFGAFVGGALTFWGFLRWRRLELWAYADAVIPAAPLGLAFARLGCLVHGCDFGRLCRPSWGIRYPAGSPAFEAHLREGFVGPYQTQSLPVLPFQAMLAAFDLLLFLVFALRPSLARGALGQRGLVVAMAYLGGRFFIEFARSPQSAPMLGLLNVAQWMSLFGLVLMSILLRRRLRSA